MFGKELKDIPNIETLNYIKEINNNKPYKILSFGKGIFIGESLIDINKFDI
ncbi:hypothetical protein KA005_19025 [bacterium]|nr:hypothetical protein [bacterium]